MNLKTLQEKVRYFNGEHFPVSPSYLALIKVVEEIGELASHYIGRIEYRVGSKKVDHQAGVEDSVADIVIALTVFCEREKIDLNKMVNSVWKEVSQRHFVMRNQERLE